MPVVRRSVMRSGHLALWVWLCACGGKTEASSASDATDSAGSSNSADAASTSGSAATGGGDGTTTRSSEASNGTAGGGASGASNGGGGSGASSSCPAGFTLCDSECIDTSSDGTIVLDLPAGPGIVAYRPMYLQTGGWEWAYGG